MRLMQKQNRPMRPNIGVLILGLFLGWTGLIKWIERLGWATLVFIATVKPWTLDIGTHFDCNWGLLAAGVVGFVCGVSADLAAAKDEKA